MLFKGIEVAALINISLSADYVISTMNYSLFYGPIQGNTKREDFANEEYGPSNQEVWI